MWVYIPLAVAALVALRLLARIVFASERVAVERAARRPNRDVRKRLERYSAR